MKNKHDHVPTQNYQKLRELCSDLLSGGVGVELAAAIGKAGRGKTDSAEKIYTEMPSTVYIHCGVKWSVPRLLREITFALSGTKPRLRDVCEQIIIDEINLHRRILFVDDAHRLSTHCLNMLRDIHDLSGAPVLMLGEEHLKTKIYRENGLKSRVRKILRFEPITASDIMVYYQKVHEENLQKSHLDRLLKSSDGDFRYIILSAVYLRKIQKASGINAITDRIIEEVCKEIEEGKGRD